MVYGTFDIFWGPKSPLKLLPLLILQKKFVLYAKITDKQYGRLCRQFIVLNYQSLMRCDKRCKITLFSRIVTVRSVTEILKRGRANTAPETHLTRNMHDKKKKKI